jgi:hypothetical protein
MWLTAVVFSVGTGCRMVQCLPHDPSASIVAAQAVATRPLVVAGRVLSIDAGAPLTNALVRLRESDSTWHPVDSSGGFLFRIPSSGAYTLEISAADYDPGIRVVVARADSGVQVVAVMARARPTRRRSSVCGIDTAEIADLYAGVDAAVASPRKLRLSLTRQSQ